MELDQARDVLDGLLVEAQRPQALGRHPGTDVVVPVEGDGAVGQEASGGGLADVVEDRGQAQDQIGTGDGPVGPGLQVDGLVEDGQGVLVDILVALVLVHGLAQGAQLGQDDVGTPVWTSSSSPRRGQGLMSRRSSSARTRSAETISRRGGHLLPWRS